MPRGDGTGPAGMGPMTGRAAGYCAGYGVPGYANPARGRPWGRGGGFYGRGGGRGWRNMYYATGLPGWARPWPAASPVPPAWPMAAWQAPSAQQQAEALKAQAKAVEEELQAIRARITELEEQAAE